MNPRLKSYLFPVVLAVLVLGLGGYFVFRANESGSPLPVVQSAPAFELTNVDGRPIRAGDNEGKVVLMEFMFTSCPDICPVTTYKMVQLQEKLIQQGVFGSKVQFVAVTFDPERDTPDVLQKYAERMGMDMSGWQVLRGEEAGTKELASRYGINVMNMGDGQFVHNVTSLQLIDARQQVRRVYEMGDGMDNDEVLKDIASLLNE
ncbi:SCO family protein [Cohnella cellulosilytica]|uniref:SCO family protein n=1 Tax=Cohnella cellulosilytica TaxID=986710 RepID=A0ABW2FAX1_9BACL